MDKCIQLLINRHDTQRARQVTNKSQKQSSAFSSNKFIAELQTVQRIQEGIAFIWLIMAAFLVLALLTYSKEDSGWSRLNHTQYVMNSGGRVGAWLADVLQMLLGALAWFIPVLLVCKAYTVFKHRLNPIPFYRFSQWICWVGAVATLVSGAALASLHFHQFNPYFPLSSGGIIGDFLVLQALPALSVWGSTIIFAAWFMLSVTCTFSIDWLGTIDWVGEQLLKGWYRLFHNPELKQSDEFSDAELEEILLDDKAPPTSHASNCSKARREPVFAHHESITSHIEDLDPVSITRVNVIEAEEDESVQKVPQSELSNGSDMLGEFGRHRLNVLGDYEPEPSSYRVQPHSPRHQVHTTTEPLPTVDLLDHHNISLTHGMDAATCAEMTKQLEKKLREFGVQATVSAVKPGPVVTCFEIQPAAGTKGSKIAGLASDLARSLAVSRVRIIEAIPGKTAMGIEIPNQYRAIVYFNELVSSSQFTEASSPLTVALGHDTTGEPMTLDLTRTPHLLVAGTTGSGKSVCINAMILSLLFKSTPDQLRMIMIDPKMLELSVYEGIPHLLAPVVTDMKEAASALRWCVAEMEWRYQLMAEFGVRNIEGYNSALSRAQQQGQLQDAEKLPLIVVVIDEFADMMMIVGKKVEDLIARLAQKARASGIHLVLATQRPSVDVITGLIKANIPTRIAFQVSSKIDSRTILDQGGAEQLLGHGDMLYLAAGTSTPVRIHGALVTDGEVHRVVADWRQRGMPNYIEAITQGTVPPASEGSALSGGLDDADIPDELYDEAVFFVTESRKASISALQRYLKIGYNRAARMIETMEAAGIVSAALSNGNREVLAPPPSK